MGRGPSEFFDAIVLGSHEARGDRVITLLTDEHGRFPAFAKGAMGSGRRFGAHIEPLTLSRVELVLGGRGMASLRGAQTQESFSDLKGDLLRFALASTMSEVVLHLVVEHGREEGVFSLLRRALFHLNRPETQVSEDLLFLFELKMLDLAGSLPPLSELSVGEAVLDVLHDWDRGHFRALDSAGRRALGRHLEGRIEDLSSRPLRSRSFLDQMLDESSTLSPGGAEP